MATIQKHYDIELAKSKPNQLLLDEISKVLERKTLTLSGWRLSAKFIPRGQFLADNPREELLATCDEVIEYLGNHYIQVLKSGTFRYTSSIRSKDLSEVEDAMWSDIAESLWCGEC
jgi:hypothetical protein